MEVKLFDVQRSSLQEIFGRTVKYKTGKDATSIGARIDANSVVADHRLRGDAVAVHHDSPMLGARVQKGFSYPHAVVVALLCQWHARSHATMDKEVVAGPITGRQ